MNLRTALSAVFYFFILTQSDETPRLYLDIMDITGRIVFQGGDPLGTGLANALIFTHPHSISIALLRDHVLKPEST